MTRRLDYDVIGSILARCNDVVAAWVFGSVARGEARPTSDLDVAVLLLEGGADVEEALRALSSELERFSPSGRVDIVVLGEQGSVFRHRVLREGALVLDRDPETRQDYEARTIVEYLDWKPTHDIAMATALKGLRRRLGGARR